MPEEAKKEFVKGFWNTVKSSPLKFRMFVAGSITITLCICAISYFAIVPIIKEWFAYKAQLIRSEPSTTEYKTASFYTSNPNYDMQESDKLRQEPSK